MLRLALLLLSLPLLAHGGEGMYYAMRNRQMTTVTCPQVMPSPPPEARWLRVVGCDIDYTHPAVTESGHRISGMYFALRMRNDRQDAPVSLVAATRDPQVLAVAQQALGNGAATMNTGCAEFTHGTGRLLIKFSASSVLPLPLYLATAG